MNTKMSEKGTIAWSSVSVQNKTSSTTSEDSKHNWKYINNTLKQRLNKGWTWKLW